MQEGSGASRFQSKSVLVQINSGASGVLFKVGSGASRVLFNVGSGVSRFWCN